MFHIFRLSQQYSKCPVQGGQWCRQTSLEPCQVAHRRCFPDYMNFTCSHLHHRLHSLSRSCVLFTGSLTPWLLCSPVFTWLWWHRSPFGLNQRSNTFCAVVWNSAAKWQQDLGIASEKMKCPMIKMTKLMSSDKSYNSLLVGLELSANTVLNIAYPSLWSFTVPG